MIHRPIVFIDVETTGLSARDGRVIEVGAVRVENGVVVNRLSELIDPGVPLPRQITAITGLRDEDLYGRRQFRNVMEDLEIFIDGCIFAAHNVDFDYSFLREEFSRNGNRLNKDRFCTAKLSRKLFPGEKGHSLEKIITRHGYRVVNRHRALDDAEVIAKFFIEMLNNREQEVFIALNKILLSSRETNPKTPQIRYVPLFD